MKKILLLVCTLLGSGLLRGQDPGAEEVYITSDRRVYLAGDALFASLFCLDGSGRLSERSAIAYLEIASEEDILLESKVALLDGRGSAVLRLPGHAATGTYLLTAYTCLSDGERIMEGSRVISIYNLESAVRVKNGVRIGESDKPSQPIARSEGSVSLSHSTTARPGSIVPLYLSSSVDSDIALSVYHLDDLAEPLERQTLPEWLSELRPRPLPAGSRMEYDGEILEFDSQLPPSTLTFLSSAGSPAHVYVTRTDEAGVARFYTGNIFGDRDIVLESESEGRPAFSLRSPFRHPTPQHLQKIILGQELRESLLQRKEAALMEKDLPLDTLLRFMPTRKDLLIEGSERIRYHLADYTQFASVEEIIREIIPILRLGKEDGKTVLRMYARDGLGARNYLRDHILVMMDGVILSDLRLLTDFDAGLLEDIDIYQEAFLLGDISYNGLVNFRSKKQYVTALNFSERVQVIDFTGTAYPAAYEGDFLSSGRKDLRQLLYWHPSLLLPARSQQQLNVRLPAYPGLFRIVAEGLDAQGRAIRIESYIDTR